MEDKSLASSVKSVVWLKFLKTKEKKKPKKLGNSMKKGEMAVTQGIKKLASGQILRGFSVRDFLKRNINIIKQKFHS